MFKDLVEKLLLKPSLAVFLLGVFLLVLAAFQKLPVGEEVLTVEGQSWRIALGVVGAAIIVWGGALTWREIKNPRRPNPLTFEYDLFVASPMAGYGDKKKFQKQWKDTIDIVAAIQKDCGIKSVYYAGNKITSIGDFEPKDVAAEIDLEAIRRSQRFLMLYPEKIMTSVIFEAGYALALGRDCVYFVQHKEHLPYLMQELQMLSREFPRVKMYVCKDREDILKTIKTSGTKLFSKQEESA